MLVFAPPLKRYWQLLCLCWLPVGVYAVVQTPDALPPSVEVTSHGVYKLIKKGQRLFDADTTAGYSSVINATLLRETTAVPIVPNQVFGFAYAITDLSTNDEWVPVIIDFTHPPMQNFYGKTSEHFSIQSAAHRAGDGRFHNSAFYVLSKPYEMVAGEWNIRLIYRDRTVVSRRFQLSPSTLMVRD